MISHFDSCLNSKTGKIRISGNEYPDCPKCGKLMKFRDTCNRHGLSSDTVCQWYILRRFKCEDCNNIHREIPDFLFPYKHYEADVIQAAIDGNTDDIYADESTIRHWRKQWQTQEPRIRLILIALLAQAYNETIKLVGNHSDIILSIRQQHSRWLAFVVKLLTIGRHPIYTQFTFFDSS